ncbi:hypothetical protein GCM10022243_37610 [Saccharothrix violaceirubra]|uniref:Uncharacterized protein n=1 Tax=Saccharothrix violaceirubra TaxID=413306 RepID=A0A7W7T4B5_9PSEU|nr:hypothetical protein [Saccharothrix violaceirubra]
MVAAHIGEPIGTWPAESHESTLETAAGGRDFLAYSAGGPDTDLRAYVFRLEQGRYPGAGDRLPEW